MAVEDEFKVKVFPDLPETVAGTLFPVEWVPTLGYMQAIHWFLTSSLDDAIFNLLDQNQEEYQRILPTLRDTGRRLSKTDALAKAKLSGRQLRVFQRILHGANKATAIRNRVIHDRLWFVMRRGALADYIVIRQLHSDGTFTDRRYTKLQLEHAILWCLRWTRRLRKFLGKYLNAPSFLPAPSRRKSG